MFVDAETGYKIREIDFNDRQQVDLYVTASDAIQQEITRGGGRFPFPMLLTAFSVGQAMRYQHLKRPKTAFYIVLDKQENPVAVGDCYPAVMDSPFEGKECYPIFHLFQLASPFTKELAEMYKAFARMLKQQGHSQIFCHIPVNHRMAAWLPIKRTIGEFPRPPEPPMEVLLELNV